MSLLYNEKLQKTLKIKNLGSKSTANNSTKVSKDKSSTSAVGFSNLRRSQNRVWCQMCEFLVENLALKYYLELSLNTPVLSCILFPEHAEDFTICWQETRILNWPLATSFVSLTDLFGFFSPVSPFIKQD